MHSVQMRKYGISEYIIQALIMTLLPTTYVVILGFYHGFRDVVLQGLGSISALHRVRCHIYLRQLIKGV